jgi:hypothetical protein
MAVRTQDGYKAPLGALWKKQGSKYGRGRFARELFNGRYQPGELLQLSNTAATYEIDEEALLSTLFECQSLGLVTLSKEKTAIVCAPNPKEMQEAYEIRAGLEEISGRTAATAFKGTPAQNTTCDSTELFCGLHRTTCSCGFGMRWQSISAFAQQ